MKTMVLRILLMCTLLAGAVSAETLSANPLRYRTFTSGQSLWMWDHTGMLMYRSDTKILKKLSLSDSTGSDTIIDVVENSGALWMVAQNGLFQVDMNTATVERIPGGPADFRSSRVAADVDFTWIAQKDALWKFDKLSREWFTFPAAKTGADAAALIGAYSDGDKVYCVTASAVVQFSIADEKWSEFPYKTFAFSPQAEFYAEKQSLIVVEKAKVFRYIIAKLSWDEVTAPSDIIDFYPSDDQIFFLTANGAYQYTVASSVMRPFDIPDAGKAGCLALLNDTTVVLTGEKTLVEYITTSRTTENIPYPQQLTGSYPVKAVKGDILLYPDAITLYNWSTRTWELYRVPQAGSGRSAVTWDENGLKMRYAPGFESQLKGSLTQRFKLIDGGYYQYVKIDSTRDTVNSTWIYKPVLVTTDERLFSYSPGQFGRDLYSDLTLHTTLSGNRYADLFFKKQTGNIPQKGFFYRGEANDIVESARIGTNTLTAPLSQTLPAIQYEGASAIVHSKAELATRDRKVVRAQAGGGLVMSETMSSTLSYNKIGQYNIGGFGSTERKMIMPGSLRINVDGEDIDTMQYTFVPLTGDITFERRDLLDPSSVIIATYKVQTIPEKRLDAIELVPENHFGQMEFATSTVSPADWVSVAGTYTTLQSDTGATRRHIGTIMTPFEFREADKNMVLKLTPEFSWETSRQAMAGGLGLQSRVGDWYLGKATSLLLNYNSLDSTFNSTDSISRGYGRLVNDLNFTLEHDVLTEIPLIYKQSDRTSVYGTEQYRQASAGAHFQNLPFLDLQLSQYFIDVDNLKERIADSTADTVSLDRSKSKVKFRLYELSSPGVQSLLHLNKFGYDLSYTHFTAQKESPYFAGATTGFSPPELPGKGDILFGSGTICPISSIIITGQTTYKRNTQDSLIDSLHAIGRNTTELNPTLTIQTIDAPPGIDFNADYSADYRGSSQIDTANRTSFDTAGQVDLRRKFYVIMKPGTWTKYLSWMSPRFGLSQNLTWFFDSTRQSARSVIFGSNDWWGLDEKFGVHMDPINDSLNRRESSVTKSIGVHLYPTDDIVLRQENDYTTSDSVTNLHMFNDAKWWFGSNRLWQTRWEYNSLENGPHFRKDMHKVFTFFDATWSSWLRTNEKLSANFSKQDSSYQYKLQDTNGVTITRDTMVTNRQLDFGPEISVSFNIQQKGIIKMLLNGHSLKLTWWNINGRFKPGAVFNYSNFINVIFKPNLSFESNNAVSVERGFVTYNGDLSVSLLF